MAPKDVRLPGMCEPDLRKRVCEGVVKGPETRRWPWDTQVSPRSSDRKLTEEEGHVTTETEAGGTQPQAQDAWSPRSWTRVSPAQDSSTVVQPPTRSHVGGIPAQRPIVGGPVPEGEAQSLPKTGTGGQPCAEPAGVYPGPWWPCRWPGLLLHNPGPSEGQAASRGGPAPVWALEPAVPGPSPVSM